MDTATYLVIKHSVGYLEANVGSAAAPDDEAGNGTHPV